MFRRRYEAGDQVLPTPQPSQPVSGQGSFPAYVQRGEWQNVGSNIKTGIVNFGNSLLSALSNPAVLGASTGVASNLIPSVNPDGQPIPELVVTGRQPSLTEGQKAASDAAHQMSMIGTRAGLQSAVYPKSRKGAGSSLGQEARAATRARVKARRQREKEEGDNDFAEGGRVGYAVGGIASRLIRKLLKRHKKDPEVQSSIYQVKKEIDDIDSELGGIGSENVELQKETVLALERDKRYLIEALEDIDVTGRPLDFDETGYPVLDDSGGVDFYGELITKRVGKPVLAGRQRDESWEELIGEPLERKYGTPRTDESDPVEEGLAQYIRKPKQEGGEIDEQMTTLMGEEEAMPAETMLPDEDMEEGFVDYVVESSLSPEDTNYLEEALAADDRLSMIFDQVVETASEFSGSGPVEGPGTEVSDSIPARLSDGEFVMTAKAADQIGPDNLQGMMEQAETDADDVVRREMAVGGAFIAEDVDEDVVLPQQGVLDASKREMLKLQLSANPRTQYRTVYG